MALRTAKERAQARVRSAGSRRSCRLAAGAAALLVVLLAAASTASANLEWIGAGVGEFAPRGGAFELSSSPSGLAVNRVTGDLYEADNNNARVLRFDKEGKLLEGWGWGVGDGEMRYERCGPEGEKGPLNEPLYSDCPGREHRSQGVPGTEEGQFENANGIAVDPSTGNVFVADGNPNQPDVVQEFTATGTFLRRFAPVGEGGGGQIEQFSEMGLAVDPAGNVYLVDNGGVHGRRVVEYAREASGEYVYKRDLFTGQFGIAIHLSIDDEGRFYLTDAAKIYRFDSPTAPSPSWQLTAPETEAETVDPATGEVIYWSAKQNLFHQVTPVGAKEAVGTTFAVAELQTDAVAGAFNPDASLPGHPAGIFYVDEGFDPVTRRLSRGLIFAPSPKFPPAVDGQSVHAVGATFATLAGAVNPKGFRTHYRFEYGTEGPCGPSHCAEAPAGGGDAGEGAADVGVSVALSHLLAETTYYFRVVAENQFGVTEGPGGSFRTYPQLEAGLPDDRAYELVSPAEKHGGEVLPADPEVTSCGQCEPGLNSIKTPEQSAPDGESVVYEGYPFFPGTEGERGALKENEYRAVRTPSGWQTRDLSLEEETHGFGYRAFTSDLGTAVLQEKETPLAEGGLPSGYEELYLRGSDGVLSPLVRELLEPFPASMELEYAGGSADLGHLVFEANAPLTAATPLAPPAPPVTGVERDLYEWGSGALRLVNVLAGNHTAAAGSVLGAGTLLAVPGAGEPGPDRSNAVSSDGSKVFWTDLGSGKLYVREHGEATREIAHSGRCKASVERSARVCFVTASTDGRRVLLSDGTLYDTSAEPIAKTADITKGHQGFQGIAGASDDLSRIYFVDTEVINPVQGPLHTSAKAGQPNLYEWEGGANAVRFIATLLPYDDLHGTDHALGTWEAAPEDRLAQVTPDGRFLAFDSVAPLTGYDNSFGGPVCSPEAEIEACNEVFEYDAAGKKRRLRVVQPDGPAARRALEPLAAAADRSRAIPQPRNLTTDRPDLLRQLRRLYGRRPLARRRERLRVRARRPGKLHPDGRLHRLLSSAGRTSSTPASSSADESGTQRVLHDAPAAAARSRPRRTRRPLRRAGRRRLRAVACAARPVHG